MANNYVLCISDNYPESYWLKAKILSGSDISVFKEGMLVSDAMNVLFESAKGISSKKLLEYDFLFSDGPNLISPRLYRLIEQEDISGVQFLDADLVIDGTPYKGYKIFNVVSRSLAFDLSRSESEPLLSYMPDGPKWYSKIVLDENRKLPSDIVRATEDFATIVVSTRVKEIFERSSVRGLQFKSGSNC